MEILLINYIYICYCTGKETEISTRCSNQLRSVSDADLVYQAGAPIVETILQAGRK